MKASVEVLLSENLKQLKLSTMLRNLESSIRQAQEGRYAYEDFLLNLTEIELQVRSENREKRRLKDAKFPLMKPMEMFEIESAVGIDGRLIGELAGCEFISKCRNVIFFGKSGTGKTHLATGIGIEACKKGFRTRFVTGCGLSNELIEARDEKVLSRIIKRYANYDLLIIDELGYVPFSKEGAELLFQVLAERHERKPVIITTNKNFGNWTEVFGDASLTAALLDRVTHKAHVIHCDWDSYRLKESLAMRGKASRLGKKLGKDNDKSIETGKKLGKDDDKSIEPGKKLGKKSGRAENA
ncbi:IS21-like element helper ATPase IstB [Desulfobacterales bacterium HSG16]|nr:IS21-like element helper ATPase IstB [Desulfobacterales bacterium HSG16]